MGGLRRHGSARGCADHGAPPTEADSPVGQIPDAVHCRRHGDRICLRLGAGAPRMCAVVVGVCLLLPPPLRTLIFETDPEGVARQVAFVLGVVIVGIASAEASKANRRIAKILCGWRLRLRSASGPKRRCVRARSASGSFFGRCRSGAVLFEPSLTSASFCSTTPRRG